MSDRPLLVTSALPYANGPLHLGHLAGAYLPADLFVRYQRLAGRDVVWVCGSDEHGAAITIRARQEGTTPQAIVDRYHAELAAALDGMGIAFDLYGRTTSETHRETSQELFRAIDGAGGFARETRTQLYDPEAGLFLADRYVTGTCPVCGYDGAFGDQCENCGSSLSPDDLVEPRSTLSGATPERRKTTHWYLPLGDLQPALANWIQSRAEWKPNVLGQVRSWLDGGLSPRAMTRDLDWGIPVPPEVEGDTDGKVLYVWFDAPIGYLSLTKEWAAAQGDADAWRHYWQVHEDGTEPELVHFIGKDNIVFHCLIFPGILMAANRAADAGGGAGRFVLPENVPANEFLNLEGRKLSTSRGWAVWASEALDAFPADLLRYALAVGLPETKDADFTWSDFQNRVNGELADVVGNFANRALTFADRFTAGAVPALEDPSDADRALLAELAATPPAVAELYEAYKLRDAVARTVGLARAGNQYLQETEPWKTRTTDERAMRNTVHVALQVCAGLSVLLDPVVPDTARRLREMLNLEGVRDSSRKGGEGTVGWADAGQPLLQPNHTLGTPGILVRKVEDEEVEAQRALLDSRSASADAGSDEPAGEPYAPLGKAIAFDQFTPLDLRAGRIVAADLHPKADKLLRFDVDLGFETRQILSGVREHYAPDDLVGQTVVVVANLAPRTIRGLESQGMILFAEDRDGALRVVETDGEPGATVR